MALPAVVAGIGAILVRVFVVKLLAALGFGIVTYIGLDAAFDSLKNYFHQGYYSMPVKAVALAEIGGFKQGINIMFSCISIRIGMFATNKFQAAFFGGGS